MYFGGLWGGQLQRYRNNKALEWAAFPADGEPALPSRVVKLSDDMLQFAEEPRPLVILDEHGHPLSAGDNARRFFMDAQVQREILFFLFYGRHSSALLCHRR